MMTPRGMTGTLHSGKAATLIFLLAAAGLEVVGDSFFQSALHKSTGNARILAFAAGAVSLILYGLSVNMASWNFGKLLGIYVVFFFVVSQLIAKVRFHETLPLSTWLGGAFIVIGGVIIWLGRL